MTRIGYARVSTTDQDYATQEHRLKDAGCTIIRKEKASGGSRAGRDELAAILDFVRPGDEVVVVKLDRLGRSTRDVLNLVHELEEKGAGLRVLEPEFSTMTDTGRILVTVLGMVAEMERVARVFDHLEDDKVEAATMACLRLARTAQDHLNAAIFLRELYPKKEEVARILYDDAQHLSDDAKKFIRERSLDRWLEIHTMDFAFPSSDFDDDKERTVLKVAAGEIEPELAQWQATLAELTPPPGLTPFDAAAF